MSAAEMSRLMHEGSLRAVAAHDAIFVDMAMVVAQTEDAEWFYAADGVHPSLAGSQLAAQTIADALRL
jgi:lysophospholipase L1-like esterase